MSEQPLILAFCCHYCAYAAADLAGSMRLQYPNNVRVLRLPCTGKVEVNHILAAFERGIKLTRNCQKALDDAEQKVLILTGDSPDAEPEPFVGNQVAGQVFIEAAQALPSYFEGWTTEHAATAFGTQFALVWAGELDLDTALETAMAEAERLIEQNA